MPITALSCVVALAAVAAGAWVAPAADKTPLSALAGLATALSDSDVDMALDYFDPKMPDFPQIEQNLEALTAQDNISCAIDIVTDTETDGVHKLDLDWFMQLTLQTDDSQLERRRERVQVEMRQIKGVWKITSMKPLNILDAIRVQ